MKTTGLLLLLLSLFLAGCTTVRTHRAPNVDLTRYQRFFVEHRLTDDRHIDETIVAALKALGKQASSGPMTMMPDDAEVVVTYNDVWQWDFRNYLLELGIQFRAAHTDHPLAIGGYRQPNMFPKTPPEVVRAILTPLFHGR